ncbi:MAG: ABC transporter substrate-binding protein [Gammaproteobacteria bacterium]|nr:ABC transporter substrate-binding protein [Gammaproteobacteria bacterium]MBU2056474.1 ABC transporter substrate-binding protein [Gammaproteobacteria bacterium]MBU2173813.1 ABC transporter substrate-binding protein [Gammaproteobacteria bacterium]MBU2248876.1 ABC transporter substrate-binding protein [Gammaproteobacteria bacterium]MBU2343998.1 ABC transporter substrate-binding protein [Gammaproteobacteria bacterium]
MRLLTLTLLLGCCCLSQAEAAQAEKTDLRLGFVKLTDMAPLAVALEQGYFEDEGLFVSVEAQANWKVLQDRVTDGQLDAAHMLAGQVVAASAGLGSQARLQTSLVLDLHGNACTVDKSIWQQVPQAQKSATGQAQSAAVLQSALKSFAEQGKSMQFGTVFPYSSHNYELRYWLAAGGIHPGFYAPEQGDNSGQRQAQLLISVTPPPQMPATMEAGTLQGFCVGEPWNQQAVQKGLGVVLVTNEQLHGAMAEKVLGVTADWAKANPNTHIKLIKALLRAGYWLDQNNNANRVAAAKMISQPHYVGADLSILSRSMTGTFEFEQGKTSQQQDFNVFFRYHATYPFYADAIWYLTQMRRWGQIAKARDDAWYLQQAQQVFQPEPYQQAAAALIAEGKLKTTDFVDFKTTSLTRPGKESGFIDGIAFDPSQPNAYLKQFAIGQQSDAAPNTATAKN